MPTLTKTLPLQGARPGVTVEAAPGKKIELVEPDPLPRNVFAELVPLGSGTYRVVPRPIIEWVEVTNAALARLGIAFSRRTMHRLGRAGFVQLRQISPGRFEFNYQSWLEHAVKCDDEEFWDQPCGRGATEAEKKQSNRERYLAAL